MKVVKKRYFDNLDRDVLLFDAYCYRVPQSVRCGTYCIMCSISRSLQSSGVVHRTDLARLHCAGNGRPLEIQIDNLDDFLEE